MDVFKACLRNILQYLDYNVLINIKAPSGAFFGCARS